MMSASQPFLQLQPSDFQRNAQGSYIIAAPGDVEPYTLGWDETIQYPAETIASVVWAPMPVGLADAPNSALYCAPLIQNPVCCCPTTPPNPTLLSSWQAITTGSFALAVDGGSVTNVTGLNFSSDTSFTQIAATIQVAVRAALTDLTTVTFDLVNNRFIFTSPTVGPAGSVAYLTTATSGVDISYMLGGQQFPPLPYVPTVQGPYQAPGVAAASVVGAWSTVWIASPVIGIYEVQATLTSSLNRVKSKTFQLQVAQNT